MKDISLPTGLRPKTKYFAEIGEDVINIDGAIALMLSVDTPEAKALARSFRRHFAEYRTHSNLSEEKQREKAMMAALQDSGVNINERGVLKGTME